MSALEDSLRKIYKLPQQKKKPTLMDGSPLPEGMVPGPTRTAEFRDRNQNGIDDRSEGIYLPRDLVPASSIPPRMNYPDAFFKTPEAQSENFVPGFLKKVPPTMPTDKDPIDELDEETKQELQNLLGKAEQKARAPLARLAEQLAMAGEGEDTELAHLRPGEIVIPPEFMDDASFESALEKKFKEFDINPEKAVVGAGIASLNPQTGLEQFGFFKKLGKKLKKVVRKVAPIATFIPGVGTALGGVLGGIGGLATRIPGIGSTLGRIGSTVAGGIAKAGIPGLSSIAGGTAGGFGGIADALTTRSGLLGGGMFGETGSMYAGGPEAGKGLANRFGFGSGTPQQVAKATLDSLTETQIAEMDPADLEQLKTTAEGGNSIFNRIFSNNQQQDTSTGGGFLSGLSDFGKTAGIGALAAGLGKLAYEDAKKQKGVPLTPLTTMSPTGRYNIEAEIARRTGQPTPNPVEFGLLPAGTIPELSGGKPKGMSLGGAIEELQGGMAMGMQEGGPVAQSMQTAMDFIMEAEKNPSLKQTPEHQIAMQILAQRKSAVDMGEQTTAQMIEEAMEIVRLAEQEPRIKDMPEYQAALDLLGGGGIGSINPMPLVPGAKLGLEQGKLANTRLRMRMGRAAGALGNKLESTAKFGPNLPMGMGMMYGGPVMAYAQGGAVALQEGGELDPSQFPRMDGDINGPGTETSDDIPAMLSDGEFVMTGRAVRGAGSYDMQKDNKGIISLIPSFNEDRERGMDLMYKMMDTFAGEAKPS
tara:strand:+ start:2589 stop:4859 length:2271 start_codon:yes stop_codon:yes gene_type:complete